jgi:DNA-directed RNA polymerase specialized sigma24 family protein
MSNSQIADEELLASLEDQILAVASSFVRSSGGLIELADARQECRLLVLEHRGQFAQYLEADARHRISKAFKNRLSDVLGRERRDRFPDGYFFTNERILQLLGYGLSISLRPDATMHDSAGIADVVRAYESLWPEQRRSLFMASTQPQMSSPEQAAVLGITESAHAKARTRNLNRLRDFLNQQQTAMMADQREVTSNVVAIDRARQKLGM